jgi:hypothetical protein
LVSIFCEFKMNCLSHDYAVRTDLIKDSLKKDKVRILLSSFEQYQIQFRNPIKLEHELL